MEIENNTDIAGPLDRLTQILQQVWEFVGNNIGFFISLIILIIIVKMMCTSIKGLFKILFSILVVLLILNWLDADLVSTMIGPDFQEKINVIMQWIQDVISRIPMLLN